MTVCEALCVLALKGRKKLALNGSKKAGGVYTPVHVAKMEILAKTDGCYSLIAEVLT